MSQDTHTTTTMLTSQAKQISAGVNQNLSTTANPETRTEHTYQHLTVSVALTICTVTENHNQPRRRKTTRVAIHPSHQQRVKTKTHAMYISKSSQYTKVYANLSKVHLSLRNTRMKSILWEPHVHSAASRCASVAEVRARAACNKSAHANGTNRSNHTKTIAPSQK